jgi:hypothetical protein
MTPPTNASIKGLIRPVGPTALKMGMKMGGGEIRLELLQLLMDLVAMPTLTDPDDHGLAMDQGRGWP